MLEILSAISGAFAFVLFFNRNPKRRPPEGKDLLLAPADGKVISTFKIKSLKSVFGVNCPAMDKQGRLAVIPINLSLLNVHVTRAPCEGRIVDVIHQRGKFLPAVLKSSLIKNQRNIIIIKTRRLTLAVIQSTGAFARRVRCWYKPGTAVGHGQVIGRILLGSNTAVVVPLNKMKKIIKDGECVRAGESIVGVIK